MMVKSAPLCAQAQPINNRETMKIETNKNFGKHVTAEVFLAKDFTMTTYPFQLRSGSRSRTLRIVNENVFRVQLKIPLLRS